MAGSNPSVQNRLLWRASIIGGALILVAGSVAWRLDAQAQATPQGPPRFEVASIRPNKTGDNRVMIGIQPGGRYTATNVPLRQLITQAYALQPSQLIGGPDWIRNDRFDIVAKADRELTPGPPTPGVTPPQQLMLRALLAERFKLVVHNETRELPVYALVLARSDKALGPKMKVSTTDCAALMAARGRGGAPPALPDPSQPMQCGMRMGPGILSAGSMTIAQLINSLTGPAQRIIVDRTGLTERYDAEMTYTPDQMPSPPPPGANAPPFPAVDPNGPSLFTALQEQLGLKLESTKAPIEVLVIDGVEQPTPD
jgi:uncharacterized protein (TIGR03435 family)